MHVYIMYMYEHIQLSKVYSACNVYVRTYVKYVMSFIAHVRSGPKKKICSDRDRVGICHGGGYKDAPLGPT